MKTNFLSGNPEKRVTEVLLVNNSRMISYCDVVLKDGFWLDRYQLNKNVSVENVRRRFEESGRFDAMRFNFLKNGRKPHVYFDSDVAKWMEAVAYLYRVDPEAMTQHITLCEELINSMEQAQRPDGYLNSTHQQIFPEQIFRNRNHHELYCAGHLIEAAIAYHIATGKDRFLHIMERYVACIRKVFMEEQSAAFITPGHEEIELALIALYRHTGKHEYLELAEFFLKNRGKNTKDTMIYEDNLFGSQDDVDIDHLSAANGHCVRALYFYSGIADLAAETGNERLLSNLRSVFKDITERKMYITGGVGSTYRAESFTVPYDLPNQTAYNESCAAIALILFAARMRQMDHNSVYGDTVERVLYNGLLSSTSLDGKSFFYENPLEVNLSEHNREVSVPKAKRERLPITQRIELFNCSCCPPNINRFFGRFADFLSLDEYDHLTLEQYVSADIRSQYGTVTVKERYAREGTVTICSEHYSAKLLSLRIPSWCKKYTAFLNGEPVKPAVDNGYATIEVPTAFVLELNFCMQPSFVVSHPLIRENAGRVALVCGPVVYCLEGIDNGNRLWQISIDPSELAHAQIEPDAFSGFCRIRMPAFRDRFAEDCLYSAAENSDAERITATFLPYYTFANRGESDMAVWIRKK